MKFAVTLFIFLGSMFSFGQDIIHFIDGRTEEVKIVEIGIEEVKYKQFDYLDGPDRVVAIKEVFKIKYENGVEEFFSEAEVEKEVVVEEENVLEKEQEISEEKELKLVEQDLFGNGFFYDVMIGAGVLTYQQKSTYDYSFGSNVFDGAMLASFGYRFGNKWYFGSSPKFRYGAQVTWGSLTFLIGGFEPLAIISPLGVGLTNVFRFKNNNGLEVNLNFSPAVMSELIDGNVSGGGNIVPGIKFRNKIFSFGIDYRFSMLYRDFELSETINMLTIGFGMKF